MDDHSFGRNSTSQISGHGLNGIIRNAEDIKVCPAFNFLEFVGKRTIGPYAQCLGLFLGTGPDLDQRIARQARQGFTQVESKVAPAQ